MPVIVQCDSQQLPAQQDIESLWKTIQHYRQFPDELVVVRCVTEEEMQSLNGTYRGKHAPTNVLTFSYDQGEHDVALCIPIAEEEAKKLKIQTRDYIALLVVHAFLHATGMDHEKSKKDADAMQQAEKNILERSGFTPLHL
jgi:probable rRNA maturation factor